MLRKIEKAEPIAAKSASEPNCLERLLTPREAADFLRVGDSWLAKARMRGDGPPFVKIGRSIRYAESALLQWTRANTHQSTSERH
jgi:predicted DNA-binding transcriptional regulator AlpA